MLRPKVGDTVILKGRVRSISGNSFSFNQDVEVFGKPAESLFLHMSRIDEIVPKPWVPKSGDRIINKATTTNIIYTLIWVKDGEVGYVVWDQWDEPLKINFKDYALCVD